MRIFFPSLVEWSKQRNPLHNVPVTNQSLMSRKFALENKKAYLLTEHVGGVADRTVVSPEQPHWKLYPEWMMASE